MVIGKRLDFMLTVNSDYISTTGVVLDGKSYFVAGQFRRWDKIWMMSMATAAGAPIIDGADALVDEDLLGGIVVAGRPPGRLIVRDTSGKNRNPGLLDWRSGVELVYVPLGAS